MPSLVGSEMCIRDRGQGQVLQMQHQRQFNINTAIARPLLPQHLCCGIDLPIRKCLPKLFEPLFQLNINYILCSYRHRFSSGTPAPSPVKKRYQTCRPMLNDSKLAQMLAVCKPRISRSTNENPSPCRRPIAIVTTIPPLPASRDLSFSCARATTAA